MLGIQGGPNPATYYPQASNYGDVVGQDFYPITGWGATGSGGDNSDWLDLSQPANPRYTAGTATQALSGYAPGKQEFAVIETGNQYMAAGRRGPTAAEFTGELWDAIIDGAQGIVYFSHVAGAVPAGFGYGPNYAPPNNMDDDTQADVVSAMTTQDARITSLASVLASPVNPSGLSFSPQANQTLEAGWRQINGQDYYFVENRSTETLTNVTFSLSGEPAGSTATDYDNHNTFTLGANGALTDSFQPYQTHIYVLNSQGGPTVPATPTNFGATQVGTTGLNITWSDNATNETSYVVQRSTSPTGTFTTIATLGANSTSYNDTNLTSGTTYYYQITAVNGAGSSAALSGSGTTSTNSGGVPADPTNLAVTTLSNSSLQLSWADNASNETSYVVQRATSSNGTYSNIATLPANSTTYTDTGLGLSATYYYKVTAVNSNGSSNAASGVGQTSVPNGPYGLTVGNPTDSSLALNWVDNSVNETNFYIQRSTASDSGFATVATLPANTTSYTDTGLSGDTTYYYHVVPTNAVGDGSYASASGTTTSGGSSGVPAAPTNFVLRTVSNSSIALSWTDNANNETSYVVQRSTSQNGTYSTIATLGANVTSYTDTGLGLSQTYYYQVFATNSSGSSSAVSGVSATSVPNGPFGLSVTTNSSSSLHLAWYDSAVNETNFIVERSTSPSSGFTTVATLAANTTSWDDTGLANGTTYYYIVYAVNDVGASSTTSASGTT